MSWGPMQIMGATARWLGFKGTFLSELIEPEVGIEYGCKYLANLKRRFSGNSKNNCNQVDDIAIFCDKKISAYNAGSPRKKADGTYVNQKYVDKVLNSI